MFPRFVKIAVENVPKVCDVRTDENGKTTLNGIDGEFLTILSQSLQFDYSFHRSKDQEWGSMTDDGNWTGMVGMISRGEVDIALCAFVVTEQRKLVVDFSEPYVHDGLTFVTNLPQTLPKMNLILTAFHWSSWLGIFSMLIFTSLVFWAFMNTNLPWLDILFRLCGSILRQSSNRGFRDKNLLNAFWWLFAPLLAIIYAAAFYSYLTILPGEKAVTSFAELSDVVKAGQYRAMALKGTFIKDSLKALNVKHINEIVSNMDSHRWYIDIAEFHNYTQSAQLPSKTAIIDIKGLYHLYFGIEPLVTKFISKDVIQDVKCSVVVRKTFCCKKKLDEHIIRINRAGLYQKILNREMYRTWLRWAKKEKSNSIRQKLSLDDVSGAFIALIAGYIISLIALIAEIGFKTLLRIF